MAMVDNSGEIVNVVNYKDYLVYPTSRISSFTMAAQVHNCAASLDEVVTAAIIVRLTLSAAILLVVAFY